MAPSLATYIALPGTVGDAIEDGNDYNVRGSAYSLPYTTDTPEEARELIAKLEAGGGSVGMPFEQAPWGGRYG